MVKSGKITELQGKEILNQFYPKSFNPMERKIGERITDEKEITKIAEEVIKENAKAVSDYKNGEKKALDFLMGMIMAKTKKRADFNIARKILEKLIA